MARYDRILEHNILNVKWYDVFVKMKSCKHKNAGAILQ